MRDLPQSWVLCTVADITVPVDTIPANGTSDREIVYVDISSIDNVANRIGTPKRFKLSEAPSRARQVVRAGDVLFSTVRPYLRNIAAVPSALDGEIASTGFAVLRAVDGVDPTYLFYKATSRDFVAALTGEQYGVSYPAVKDEQVRARPFELPPTREQHRIVAKIEELFSELDKAVESLTLARAQLKTYRQALLKAAFEGRLTADWRAANPDKLEPPETLLARIRSEREACYRQALADWQTALAEWHASGEVGRKPAKPDRPAPIEIMSGNDLPDGWTWISTKSLGRVETGNTPSTKSPECFSGAVPFLKPTDLDAGYWVREARDHLSEEGLAVSRGFPPNTVLVTCIGATIGKTGLSRVAGACNQQINFVVPDNIAQPAFVFFQMIGPSYQKQIKDNASSTTLPILNKGRFCELPFAVCGRLEQAAIVALLEERLSQTEAAEGEIDRAAAKSIALRQSILKQAFSGHLVSQDPTDEPAAALLARLREQAPAPRTRRRRSA